MGSISASQDYIERVKAAAVVSGSLENIHQTNRTPHATSPVASWLNGTPRETTDLHEVFALARSDGAASQRAVCIVENIDWIWMAAMGVAWEIEPHFFADHGVNPQGDNAWRTLFPEDRRLGATQGPSKYKHVDGVFEHQYLVDTPTAFDMLNRVRRHTTYRRRCWAATDSSYPPSSSTRISYCRVNANLYLFLVDPPPFPTAYDAQDSAEKIMASMEDLRCKTRLRVQCPSSCGIFLPQLLKHRVYCLRQALHSVFRHNWHLQIMFDDKHVQDVAINRGELLHLMSSSLHRTNFTTIDQEIKAVSFQELRNPNFFQTNAKLLTLREVLSELATSTGETSKYAPSHVKRFYDDIYDGGCGATDELDFHSPVARLDVINKQANDLERFLMDSFQLLMSTISVRETQIALDMTMMSNQQAARTAMLTQLAFVYVPLTFVTSIFGMNVKELSEPVPSVWVCLVTLVVVAVATAAIFGSYKYKPVNLVNNLLRQRETKPCISTRTAVPPEGIEAVATDVEKGSVGLGLVPRRRPFEK